MNTNPTQKLLLVLTALAASTSIESLQAATWNSATSGNFSDSAMWLSAAIPASSEGIIFTNTTGVTATVDSAWPAAGVRRVNAITFNSGVGANTLAAGPDVTTLGVTGTITNSSSNLQIFGAGLQLDIGTGSGRGAIGGRLQFDGIVNLNSDNTSTFRVNSGQITTFNAPITGGMPESDTNFTLSGGTVALNAPNTFLGTINFDSATTVNIGAASNLGDSAGPVVADDSRCVITYLGTGTVTKGNLTLNQTNLGSGDTLDLRSASGTFEFTGAVTNADPDAAIQMGSIGARLILSGNFTSSFGIAGRNNSTLTFANTSGTQSTSGILGRASINSGNVADNNFNVVRNAAGGTTLLSGNQTYVGTTTVTAGSLFVNGTHVGGANYSVSGLLGGTGTITPAAAASLTVNAGGILAPGSDVGLIGTLTLDGLTGTGVIATLASGAKLAFDLDGSLSSADRLALNNGASGDVVFNNNVIDFTTIGVLADNQTFTLFSATAADNYSGLTLDGSNKIIAGLSIGSGLSGFGPSYLSLVGSNIVLNLVVDAPTGNALTAFRTANSLASDGSQDLLTPAGDGTANLLKYAFNMIGAGAGQAATLDDANASILAPAGSAGLPLIGTEAGTGKLTLTYIRRKAAGSPAPGVSYEVQFNSDLTAPASWAVNASATESVTSLDDTFERVVVTDSITGTTKRFARVQVTSVPAL